MATQYYDLESSIKLIFMGHNQYITAQSKLYMEIFEK